MKNMSEKRNSNYNDNEPSQICTKIDILKKKLVSEYDQKTEKSKRRNKLSRLPLWYFLYEMANSSTEDSMVRWTDMKTMEILIENPSKLAFIWGKVKNIKDMSYATLARGIRYYYGKGVMEKGKRGLFSYRFVLSDKTRNILEDKGNKMIHHRIDVDSEESIIDERPLSSSYDEVEENCTFTLEKEDLIESSVSSSDEAALKEFLKSEDLFRCDSDRKWINNQVIGAGEEASTILCSPSSSSISFSQTSPSLMSLPNLEDVIASNVDVCNANFDTYYNNGDANNNYIVNNNSNGDSIYTDNHTRVYDNDCKFVERFNNLHEADFSNDMNGIISTIENTKIDHNVAFSQDFQGLDDLSHANYVVTSPLDHAEGMSVSEKTRSNHTPVIQSSRSNLKSISSKRSPLRSVIKQHIHNIDKKEKRNRRSTGTNFNRFFDEVKKESFDTISSDIYKLDSVKIKAYRTHAERISKVLARHISSISFPAGAPLKVEQK